MLTVRRLPRTRVALPALLGSLESTAALALAHTVAGGDSAPALWLVAFGVVVYAAGLVVLRERARIALVAPLVLGAQVLGHAWLVALAPGHAHTSHGGDMTGGVLGLSPAMLAAHAFAAVVAAGMWALRRRVVELVLHWAATVAGPAVRPGRSLAATRLVVRPRDLSLRIAPTRGPPVGVATA